jgi:hypothetical protein
MMESRSGQMGHLFDAGLPYEDGLQLELAAHSFERDVSKLSCCDA